MGDEAEKLLVEFSSEAQQVEICLIDSTHTNSREQLNGLSLFTFYIPHICFKFYYYFPSVSGSKADSFASLPQRQYRSPSSTAEHVISAVVVV